MIAAAARALRRRRREIGVARRGVGGRNGLWPAVVPLVAVAAVCALHGQNREWLGSYKIGVIGRGTDNAAYQAVNAGAQAAARDLSEQHSIDIDLDSRTFESAEPIEQAKAIGRLYANGADGIAISPMGGETLRPVLEFAGEIGVEVVYFERSFPGVAPLAEILADERAAAKRAAETVLKHLSPTDRAAVLVGDPEEPGMAERMRAVRETLGEDKIHRFVESAPNYAASIRALERAMAADASGRIGAWIFLADWPLQGAPALPWRPNGMICVALHSSPTAFHFLRQRYISALVAHPYFEWGYESVRALIEKLHLGVAPDRETRVTEPFKIDWRNMDKHRERWKNWIR